MSTQVNVRFPTGHPIEKVLEGRAAWVRDRVQFALEHAQALEKLGEEVAALRKLIESKTFVSGTPEAIVPLVPPDPAPPDPSPPDPVPAPTGRRMGSGWDKL